MSAQPDLFAATPDPRDERLRGLMLAELRKPWPGSPAIAEPSDAAKIAFVDAFVRTSLPAPPCSASAGVRHDRTRTPAA